MTKALPSPSDLLALTEAAPVHTDLLHRYLYAQDASVYSLEPVGVAFPRDAGELQKLVLAAHSAGIPLVPRAAGTSLAGQATGSGLVVDTGRHMNQILELNTEERWVRVQPGVILDDLNRYLKPHGLFFGPDTSTSNRCMIAGMIGNNSCGSHSILYGNTMHHVLEVDAIFADGTRELLKDWDNDVLLKKMEQHNALGQGLRELDRICKTQGQAIEDAYPPRTLVRRNTGYALDDVLWRAPYAKDAPPFNLARFLCGTEGTIAFIAEAKLNLVPEPTFKGLVCAHFHDLIESLEATVLTIAHKPAAVELIDRTILDQTKTHLEHQHNRFFVQGDPAAVLVIEFYRDSEAEVRAAADAVIQSLRDARKGYAYPVVMPPDDNKVWNLRKAGLGLLMGVPGDKKAVSVVEDTAVDVPVLPAYIADFQKLMLKYETESVYHAHASVGELHLRPELNLKDPEDVRKFVDIAGDTARLVKSYRGSLSGEHGDGRVRSPLLNEFYGDEVYALHLAVKDAFDPKGIMNPGIIVGSSPMDHHFRAEPGADTPELEKSYFDWSDDLGFMRALEKCNGAGACRKLPGSGGTMCPSYMATLEEKDSTRGRANVFRQVFLNQPTDWMNSDVLEDALALCLSCKACKSECPASVDMARLKAEFLQHKYDQSGPSLRARFFGHHASLSVLGRLVPPLSNAFMKIQPTRSLMNTLFGLAPERELPQFHSTSARRWLTRRHVKPEPVVWLYVDPFTEFLEPEIAIQATQVLEKLGYGVALLPIEDDGRAFISKGLLRSAKKLTDKNLKKLEPLLKAHPERLVIGIEPSALLTLRDETPDLANPSLKETALALAARVVLFDEFLSDSIQRGDFPESQALSQSVLLHQHCHQKALCKAGTTERVLKACGYEVKTLPTGCCGMAGSFGYEAENYEVSMKIGELVLFPTLRESSADVLIAAPGTSCRHQIKDGVDKKAEHPITLVARALLDSELVQPK